MSLEMTDVKVLEPQSAALVSRMRAGGARELLDHSDMGALRAQMREFLRACAPQPLPVGATERRQLRFKDRDVEVIIYGPLASQPGATGTSSQGKPLLQTHDPIARYLCNKSGAVVVSVDYRLAPEHKFPAPLEDAYDTLCWAHANAGQLGADPTKIVVAGESAGGTIAVALCLITRERGGPPIALQIPMCASLTLSEIDRYPSWRALGDGRYLLSRAAVEEIRRVYLNRPEEATNPLASPLLASDLTALPPALVICAECDPLVDEAAYYSRRLEEAGVPVTYKCFAGTIHSFMILAGVIDLGHAALDLVAEHIRTRAGVTIHSARAR
jgi:acetyl esterase